jgi:hypothetical protein
MPEFAIAMHLIVGITKKYHTFPRRTENGREREGGRGGGETDRDGKRERKKEDISTIIIASLFANAP